MHLGLLYNTLMGDFFVHLFLFCWDGVSWHSPGWLGTPHVDHAGTEFKDLPASAFQELGVCYQAQFTVGLIGHLVSISIAVHKKFNTLNKVCYEFIFCHYVSVTIIYISSNNI